MKIELNKEYLTRTDKRVTVTQIDDGSCWPVKCSDGERRNLAGAYSSTIIPDDRDLVLPAKERPRLYQVTLTDADGNQKSYRRSALNETGAIASLRSIIERDGLTVVSVELQAVES